MGLEIWICRNRKNQKAVNGQATIALVPPAIVDGEKSHKSMDSWNFPTWWNYGFKHRVIPDVKNINGKSNFHMFLTSGGVQRKTDQKKLGTFESWCSLAGIIVDIHSGMGPFKPQKRSEIDWHAFLWARCKLNLHLCICIFLKLMFCFPWALGQSMAKSAHAPYELHWKVVPSHHFCVKMCQSRKHLGDKQIQTVGNKQMGVSENGVYPQWQLAIFHRDCLISKTIGFFGV